MHASFSSHILNFIDKQIAFNTLETVNRKCWLSPMFPCRVWKINYENGQWCEWQLREHSKNLEDEINYLV